MSLADTSDPRFTDDQRAVVARFDAAVTPPEVREAAVVEEVARAQRFADTAMRCLDRALGAMNRAIELTTEDGPAVAMEFIADFLNDTDGIDEDVADATPDDWLTRWQVSPTAAVAAVRAAQDGGAEEAVRPARAEAFQAAANRLTIAEPQAALNWCQDQARIALGEEPYRDWTALAPQAGEA